MPRKRTVTAQRVTEQVTVTVETADTAPITWAAGCTTPPAHPAQAWNAQRRTQATRALHLLAMWDASAPADEPAPEWLTRQAVNILRALPGATPLELTLGRSA